MTYHILKFGRFVEYKKPTTHHSGTGHMRISMDENNLFLGAERIPLTFIYHIDLQSHYLQISYWNENSLPVVRSLTTAPLLRIAFGRKRRLKELENCLKTSIHAAKATMLLKGRLTVRESGIVEAFGLA